MLGPLVAAGVTIHLSYKTNPMADVLAWAAGKPAGLPLFLTRSHEPEQQKDGDPTVEQFHAAWAELVPAFDGAPMRDEIWLGPTFTRFWWQANAGDRRWMPRVPVDFVGWDIYNNGLTYRTPTTCCRSLARSLSSWVCRTWSPNWARPGWRPTSARPARRRGCAPWSPPSRATGR
ncbi:hypothetical protein V2I01_04765 [Micromonospora sp. BRA006-A]|nr:hypothetical protein [Micromonospora sp. BRA006-A]